MTNSNESPNNQDKVVFTTNGAQRFINLKPIPYREYFAAMAMQAILSKPVDNIKQAAKESVIAADALIEALNESKPTENEIQTNQQDNR